MKTILSHANLIDCVQPKVRPDAAVLIEDGRIRAIGPSREAGDPGDAQVIDLAGAVALLGYSLAAKHLVMHRRWSTLVAASVLLLLWLAIAFALWAIALR